jgi:hypothetical protein
MICSNCDNLINISKTTNKINNTYSDEYINNITTLILTEKQSPIMNPDIAQRIIKSDVYTKLTKVQQKSIQSVINDYTNAEILSNVAYYKCSNCGFTKQIPPKTHITTIQNPHSFANFNNNNLLANIKHSNIDPLTTNYICPNTECISHKEKHLKPAKFTKTKNLTIYYVCPYCDCYWTN